MSSKLHQLVLWLFIQSWRPLVNYAVKAGVVCLQVKLCDPHLSALEVRFSRRGAIQIYVYLYLYYQAYYRLLLLRHWDYYNTKAPSVDHFNIYFYRCILVNPKSSPSQTKPQWRPQTRSMSVMNYEVWRPSGNLWDCNATGRGFES